MSRCYMLSVVVWGLTFAAPTNSSVLAAEPAKPVVKTYPVLRMSRTTVQRRSPSQNSGYGRGGTGGLPYGRRYFNGRYFGNLNDRFYGPQYGYF